MNLGLSGFSGSMRLPVAFILAGSLLTVVYHVFLLSAFMGVLVACLLVAGQFPEGGLQQLVLHLQKQPLPGWKAPVLVGLHVSAVLVGCGLACLREAQRREAATVMGEVVAAALLSQGDVLLFFVWFGVLHFVVGVFTWIRGFRPRN